jgi:hypothetical protein
LCALRTPRLGRPAEAALESGASWPKANPPYNSSVKIDLVPLFNPVSLTGTQAFSFALHFGATRRAKLNT